VYASPALRLRSVAGSLAALYRLADRFVEAVKTRRKTAFPLLFS